MKLFLCALLAVALAEDPLRAVLRSPKAALNLYSDFKSANKLSFGVGEDRMRQTTMRTRTTLPNMASTCSVP